MEIDRSGFGGKAMNNSGLGGGDGVVETMDGRGTSQGGYGTTSLMDRRDAWKQLCLVARLNKKEIREKEIRTKMEKRKGKGNRQNNATFLKEKIEQRVV
ncbi:unnamed protein product [Cochlearia groenlandica]